MQTNLVTAYRKIRVLCNFVISSDEIVSLMFHREEIVTSVTAAMIQVSLVATREA